MDGELKHVTLWIMILDELKKEAERFISNPFSERLAP
jgi:hypothetical protein